LNYQPILLALGAVTIIFGGLGLFTRKRGFQSIAEFFLASRSVSPSLVTSLLVSGSFSLNGMLYQIYLGYKIGAWALITQLAWAASFFLLARHTDQLVSSAGLHNFLGTIFSPLTRKLAALCSIIGLGLQIGWEYGVAKSAFAGLGTPALPTITVELFVFTVFSIGTFYTLVGGMRSNSWTDLFENLLKGACFVVLGFLLFGVAGSSLVSQQLSQAVFPPFSQAVAELTIAGFITNIGFSLAWQFVDMSTWQTAVSTKTDNGSANTRRSLRWAGVWVFIAPGILGTVIGLGLTSHPNLTSDSVLPALIQTLGGQPIIVFILTIALAATVMSFIDGMMLGIGYTFITDLLFSKLVDRHQLLSLPDEAKANDPEYQRLVTNIMGWTRIALVVTAITATYVVTWFADALHVGLFDQVYLVVIGQLALFGPVLVGLRGRLPYKSIGPPAILVPLAVGYGLAIYGTVQALPDLVNAASMIALALSFAIAYLGSRRTSEVTVKPISSPS
jgi:hypothetical protein